MARPYPPYPFQVPSMNWKPPLAELVGFWARQLPPLSA
jgi:hypothetical protein